MTLVIVYRNRKTGSIYTCYLDEARQIEAGNGVLDITVWEHVATVEAKVIVKRWFTEHEPAKETLIPS